MLPSCRLIVSTHFVQHVWLDVVDHVIDHVVNHVIVDVLLY